jgi:lantibiotic biosynthesis dehydratase-like protein
MKVAADQLTDSGSATDHLVDLAGDWALWSDFAVRSAGFPVEGLRAFGGEGESERLAEVARDPAFQEAVAWQSRESLSRAVDKHARELRDSPSRVKRRQDVVARYWQRYCAKNDTIGFFGPLAWGRFADQGEAVAVRAGAVAHERVVHLENWAVEAVAAAAGVPALVPMGPFPERDLRALLDDCAADSGQVALAALDRVQNARDAVARAPREALVGALDDLDRVFEAVTGRPPVRAEDESGGGRTVAYLDCMRDLDLTVGPGVLEELRSSLPAVLYASRWWCGRVFAAGGELLARIAHGRSGPLGPLLGELMGAAWGLHDCMGDEQQELQRRWAAVVGGGDDAGVAERAASAFADYQPAWRHAAHQSADIQIAAADTAAIERGEFQIVLGDFHGGANPLAQGMFAERHPQPGAVSARVAAELGPAVDLLPPRRGVVPMTARMFPVYGGEGDVVVVAGDEPAPPGTRAVGIGDVVVHDGHVSDRAGSFRVALAELLFLPIFVSAIRSFDPIGRHVEGRATIGRTVVRRASWSAPASALPSAPDDIAAWARDGGLPRRVFARSPLERKPIFIDFESPSLRRVLARFIAPAVAQSPGAPVQFTEMLPGPDECWLESEVGHHTSELRIVALDRSAGRARW